MFNVYIGWDSREPVAYDVCKHSILSRTNLDVNVIPLKQHEMRERSLYWREKDKLASTEFTFTRFLVPALNQYKGWAIFADCDFLWLSDIQEIFDMADESKAVQVVQHEYTPPEAVKMDGKQQHQYPRKNWSSMILWNCDHISNHLLSVKTINEASGAFLHRFQWMNDIHIGETPYQYNYLEGWYHTNDAKVVHYTRGGPWFKEYWDCDYSQEWKDEYKKMTGKDYTQDDCVG